MPTTLVRRTNETPRYYWFDFNEFPELVTDGDTLSSVVSVSATPSGLTLGSGTIVSGRVKVQISGGVAGTTYLIKCLALTGGGSRLEVSGYLRVTDPV